MERARNRSIIWLAGRYLRGQGAGPVSRAHYLTVIGITLGVTALLCVSSVMNGFRSDIRSRVTGTLSEIRVSSKDGSALQDPDALVRSLQAKCFRAAPVVRNDLVLKHGSALFPTLCYGIDPALHAQVSTSLNPPNRKPGQPLQGLIAGSVLTPDFRSGGIALGSILAQKLNVMPGAELQLFSPLFNVPSAFGLLPRVRTLRVTAIFHAGMPEYDENFSYVSLDTARFFKGYAEGADYLELRTPDFEKSARYARQLRSLLSNHRVEDWSAYDASLYAAIRFEKYIMFVIMLFMYVIASFNLTGNMLKSIAQKKRELGLLKALGYKENDLRDVFLCQSLILSSLGIALGTALAALLLYIQIHYGLLRLDMGDALPMPLPVKPAFMDYLAVILASYIITLLSVIFPLRRLRRINAIELIRQNT